MIEILGIWYANDKLSNLKEALDTEIVSVFTRLKLIKTVNIPFNNKNLVINALMCSLDTK